jgi:DNA repair exonuclease SbcCD nuclease subunit
LGISEIILLGDIFKYKKAQGIKALTAFDDILVMVEEEELTIRIIDGNHDKVDESSDISYLRKYRFHPNVFYYNRFKAVGMFDLNIVFASYFSRDTYISYAAESPKLMRSSKKNILITHIGLEGAFDNNGEPSKDAVPLLLFKGFDQVFIGHYHNRNSIGKKVHYIGSMYPATFGENNEKGITIVNSDGSFYHEELDFVKYFTIDINLDKKDITVEKLYDNITSSPMYKRKEAKHRVIFTGEKSKVEAVDTNRFELAGISVKCVKKDTISENKTAVYEAFTDNSIREEFDRFIEEKQLDKDASGREYLEKLLT